MAGRTERVSRGVGIGASIFLIALGLILALAVDVKLSGIDLQLVGWILAVVGVVGLLITLTALNRRRTTVRGSKIRLRALTCAFLVRLTLDLLVGFEGAGSCDGLADVVAGARRWLEMPGGRPGPSCFAVFLALPANPWVAGTRR